MHIRDINAYSATLTGTQLGRRGEAFPALIENRKNCPDFGRKGPDCCIIRLNLPLKI